MLVLAFETSVDPCGMALADEKGILSAVRFRHHMDLSSTWAPTVKRMLQEAGVHPTDLAGLATSLGPGSFTGLRIGVVAAKTMAQALNCRLIGISTLELLALPFRSVPGLSVLSLVPCRRGEVYAAVYHCTGNSLIETAPGRVMKIEHAAELFLSLPESKVVAGKAAPKDSETPSLLRAEPWHTASSAEVLALEARRRMLLGENVDPVSLLPIYIKRSQAEERLAGGD
jgi:tRNA threonylcarbamoyladenosine biosynthesis protein TsaB